MGITTIGLIPAKEKWFTFKCAGGELPILLARHKESDLQRARAGSQSWTRFDRSDLQTHVDLKKWHEFLAEKVILDWKITDQNGQPWPCSLANKLQLLDDMSDFAEFVGAHVKNEDAYRGNAPNGHDSSISGEPPVSPKDQASTASTVSGS